MSLLFHTAGSSPALSYATAQLQALGIPFISRTDLNVTHLLLPVPSFTPEGQLVGGGDLQAILPQLSPDITVIGGNLSHPVLAGYKTLDLLQDPEYVAVNAMITAHCALAYAIRELPVILENCPVLVLGWGRIAKCLCKLLQALGADITVAARKPTDRAMAKALGFHAVDIQTQNPAGYRLIFNTIPAMVLPQGATGVKIDLASKPGIGGDGVICARGLPGKDAPESSGRRIAESVYDLVKGALI